LPTGEFVVAVAPPNAAQMGSGQTIMTQPPGTYGVKFSLSTQPNEQEPFSPGAYQVLTAVCEGT